MFSILLIIPYICACSTTKTVQKNKFIADMPMPFEEYFKNVEVIDPSIPTQEITFWDVSDVDISYVDLSRKLIAFTFDDAPLKTLENICAVFAEYNENNPDCKATSTIFVNGSYVEESTVHQLHTAHILGMELGNHTHSHLDLTALDEAALKREIQRTDEILSKVDEKKQHLLRAPFGKINEQVKSIAKSPIIDWTIDTLDWTNVSAEQIYKSIFNGKFSGAIVLMHDGPHNTVEALKRLLPDLKNAGYQVVSVSALAKAHGCKLKNGSVYIRARKQ